MKLGIFTDSHYCSAESTYIGRYNNKSLVKIKQAMEHFADENCDAVICLGDLTDFEDTHEEEVVRLKEIAEVINSYPMKKIVLQGNHDAFAFEEKEFYDILGDCKPEIYHYEKGTLVFLDACYFKSGIRYQPGDSEWKDTYYPFEKELESILSEIKGDTYIFLHQILDPSVCENHRLFNDVKIRKILENSKKVKKVFQGHYHPGNKNIVNGIEYVTFPAMCEKDDAYFILEI